MSPPHLQSIVNESRGPAGAPFKPGSPGIANVRAWKSPDSAFFQRPHYPLLNKTASAPKGLIPVIYFPQVSQNL